MRYLNPPRNWARLLLKALTYDRREKTFAEVRASVLKGDFELTLRLFEVAPSVDWICRILGFEEAQKVWLRVKPFLKPSDHPFSLYRQCEAYLEYWPQALKNNRAKDA
ncbi:hypothetical protein [Thermosulfurimonas sp. F29]|uniref:hypothetical protein n=1 Tax=Thermosulfurimonas sp. F29 TaxID=2867247 RepID=UPI001C82D259|nr:hypothetical protein [Thermosulfurimonas sp. F29]MBX6423436.1 hypothetical protein [Thermosulfurimonas sp. F29]